MPPTPAARKARMQELLNYTIYLSRKDIERVPAVLDMP
jgi:hypothetical protein